MIGIDIIELDRMREILDRTGEPFIQRVFSPSEQTYADAGEKVRFFASAFAAKEAIFKALAFEHWSEELNFAHIEIGRDASGRPTACLNHSATSPTEIQRCYNISLSISYETNLVAAAAFISPT